MTKHLILVGVSTRAAAQAARRAGLCPYSIDLFADVDTQAAGTACKVSRFPADFVDALRDSPESSPWMYTGGLENYPDLVDQIARERQLLGNRGAVLRNVRDPVRLGLVLQNGGFNYPAVSSGGPSIRRVRKPLRSGGGRGVHLVGETDKWLSAPGWYEQQYVEGLSASALYVADGKITQLLGASRQILGRDFGLADPFAYVGSIAPLVCSASAQAQMRDIGLLLARQFELTGVFGVDFILCDDQVWVLEVNPRFTSSAEVVELATGYNCVAVHVAACTAGLPNPCVQCFDANLTFYGKAIVYARSAGIAGDRFARWIGDNSRNDFLRVVDLPQPGSHFAAGEPVATVLADAASAAEVERVLAERAKQLLSTLEPL